MKPRHLAIATAALLLPFALVLWGGCEEEQVDPPIVTTSAAAPSSSEPVTVETEDAGGTDAADADAAAARPTGKGPVDPLRIGRCCEALRRNKPMAPPAQQGAYDSAIAACELARRNPAAIATVVKVLPSAPPACQ
jgi:hypothetical protein